MASDQFSISLIIKAIDEMTAPLQRMAGSLGKFQEHMDANAKRFESFKKMGEGMVSMGESMTKYLTLPIIGLGGFALKAAGEFEQLETSFGVFLQSEEKGAALTKELVKLGAATPFETRDLAQATQALLQNGIAQKDIVPTLTMLGDVAGSSNEKLQRLAYTFGQVSLKGKADGMDIREFINSGFNPLAVLAKKAGIDVQTFTAKLGKSGLTAKQVGEAFKIATSQGGMFYQHMLKQSRTLFGLMSTFRDVVNMALADFGNVLMDVLDLRNNLADFTKILGDFGESLKVFSKENPTLMKFIILIGLLVAAIGPLIMGLGMLTIAMTALVAHPLVLTITLITLAIAALVIGIIWLWRNFDTLKDRWNNTSAAGKAFLSVLSAIFWPITATIAAVKTLHDNLENLKKLWDLFTNNAPNIGEDVANSVNSGKKLGKLNVGNAITNLNAKSKNDTYVEIVVTSEKGIKTVVQDVNTTGTLKLKGNNGNTLPANTGRA